MTTRSIASLSSIPPRFAEIGPTLEALTRQSLPFDEIRLVIPYSYRRFPDWDGRLPVVPDGVVIHRCEEDLGPATKVLPVARALRGQDAVILFCDDDRLYEADWHARFRRLADERPGTCIVEAGETLPDIPDTARSSDRLPRMRREQKGWQYRLLRLASLFTMKPPIYAASGYADILAGFAGVLVRPEWFDDAVFDIPELLWTVDDPWLSGHLERRGIPIWLNRPRAYRLRDRAGHHWMRRLGRLEALQDFELEGQGRVAADLAAIRYMRETYGIWTPDRMNAPPPDRQLSPSMRALMEL